MTADMFKSRIASWIHSRTNDYDLARSQVLRFNDVYDMLREGITHFWFRKGDGSLRSAYGTLDMAIVERHGGVPQGSLISIWRRMPGDASRRMLCRRLTSATDPAPRNPEL